MTGGGTVKQDAQTKPDKHSMNWNGSLRLVFVVSLAIPLGLPLGNCGICTDVANTDAPVWETVITSPFHEYAGRSVAELANGDLLVAGYSFTYEIDDALLLVRRTAFGNPGWVREFRDPRVPLRATRVIAANDGGALVFGVAGGGSAGTDYYILRTDADGNKLWDKRFGGARMDTAVDVLPLEDGYLLLGSTESTGSGGADIELIRVDSAGDLVWSRTYGGAADDFPVGFLQTEDGGLAMFGATASFGSGDLDYYLVKTDAFGEEQWYQTYGYANLNFPGAMLQTEDGGYLLAGNTGPAYLVKTDVDGALVWERVLGGDGYYEVRDIAARPGGGYVMTGPGKTLGDDFFVCAAAFLMETGGDGQLEQVRLFGEFSETESHQMIPTSDNRFVLVGVSNDYPTELEQNYKTGLYLAKVGAEAPQ
jgi:hypothetical protein